MPVVTRSQARAAAAAGRGLSTTNPNAQSGTNAPVYGNAARGANKNRASIRDRGTKNTGALQTIIPREGEESAIDVHRPRATSKSRSLSRRNDNRKRGVVQPQAAVQSTSLACGSGPEPTFQHARTPENGVSGPSSSRPDAGKKVRKGLGSTTKSGSSKTWAGRARQQKDKRGNDIVRADAKRHREDEEDQPGETGEGELVIDPAPRTSRRLRRETKKTIGTEAQAYEAVVEAVTRSDRKKGKAKAVDLPSSEEASVGSKRRRDEDEADAEDVSQKPVDPRPSCRITRRIRQKVEVPEVGELERKPAKERRERQIIVPSKRARARGAEKGRKAIDLPKASTPESCESGGHAIPPIRLPSTSAFEAQKSPTPLREQTPVTVEQKESTLSPILHHASMEQAVCKREPSEEPSMLVPPRLPAQAATVIDTTAQVEETKNDYEGDSGEQPGDIAEPIEGNGTGSKDESVLVQEESISSSSLDRESLSSLSDSDKENVPIQVNPLEFWLQRSPQFAIVGKNSPEEGADDRQDDYEYSILQPRRPLETLSSRPELAPGNQESETTSSEEGNAGRARHEDDDDDDATSDRSVSTESISPMSLRMRWISELYSEDSDDDEEPSLMQPEGVRLTGVYFDELS